MRHQPSHQKRHPPWIPSGVGKGSHVVYKDNAHPHYHEYTKPPTNNEYVSHHDMSLSTIKGGSGGMGRVSPSDVGDESDNHFNYRQHRHGGGMEEETNRSAFLKNSAPSAAADDSVAHKAMSSTSAHRKYSLVVVRSTADQINKRAIRSFQNRMSTCLNKFEDHYAATREALYSQVELQTSSAISEMEEATKKIKEEVFKRYEEAGKLIKEETMQKAKDAIIVKYAELEPELLAKIEEEGPDAAARHRAREVMEKKIKVLQDELNNEHKKGLENGALERLNEREQQLADQRIEVQQRLDEETRERMSELSAKLSADAKVQISTYRIELEDLRESRVTAARAKENEITDKELQKVKEKFMQQATEEVGLCQIGAKEEEEAMLAGIKEEVKRYQELRAAEITTQARTVRAQALPSMAIELEERAEAIERQYRMGLIAEDTHEETEAISSSVVELKKHVFGAREAVFSDNEQFVRDITDDFHNCRSEILRARAKYLNVPGDDGGLGVTSVDGASIKQLTTDFETLRQKYVTMGARLVDTMLEKILLSYEVKAARVRRSLRAKEELDYEKSTSVEDRKQKDTNVFCPTCKPLMEANLELRKVASRKKQAEEEEGIRKGGGGKSNFSATVRGFQQRHPGMHVESLGRVEGEDEGEELDADDISVESTASSREAEFVKRFLGKVTKNAGTLRGTLAMLNKGAPRVRDGGGLREGGEDLGKRAAFQSINHLTREKEFSTSFVNTSTFDEAINETLLSSKIHSHESIENKHKQDRELVQGLLKASNNQLREKSMDGGEGRGGGGGEEQEGMNESSFLFNPVERAPALAHDKVRELVDR